MPASFSRRQFLLSGTAGLGSLALSSPSPAIPPVARLAQPSFKLSLAAYALRQFLPNYRSGIPSGTEPLDLFGFIDYCAKLGLEGAELTSYFLPDPCPRTLAAKLKRHAHLQGVAISGGAIGNNFSHPPGALLNEQLAYTKHWIETYALMGAPVIRVFGGKPTKDVSSEQAEEHIIQNLKTACDFAGEHGVLLAVENHDFMVNIDRFLRIVQAVDSPWLGANLDSGNFAPTPDPYRDFERVAPYAINIQFKAAIPRNGKKEPADFSKLISILRQTNYRGYLVLEYEEKGDPYKAIPQLFTQLRALTKEGNPLNQ